MPALAAIFADLSQHIGSTSVLISVPHGGGSPDVPSTPGPDIPDSPDIPGDSGTSSDSGPPSNSGTPGNSGVPSTPGRPGLVPEGGESGSDVGENAGDIGQNAGDAVGGSVDLSPELTAVFSFTITIAIITLYQLWRAASRFKKLVLPEGEPKLPYDVGRHFRVLLAFYLSTYLLYNVLYAVLIALAYGDRLRLSNPSGFSSGTAFVGQLADVMFFATLLTIITYRQRIQLNLGDKHYKTKSFVDRFVLVPMLILGIAQDVVSGNGPTLSFSGRLLAVNLAVAYEALVFAASVDVVISAYMARTELAKAGIEDDIIQTFISSINPVVLIGAIYRIISIGLTRSPDISIDGEGLLIADTIIGGLVSIFVVERCLAMGAPPTPPKDSGEGNTSGGIRPNAS